MDAKQILALYDQDRKSVRLFGMLREETSHLVRHISPRGEGLIMYSNLNSTNVEEVIQEQIAHFGNIGCDFSWVVYQHDTPTNLKDRLIAHGFRAEDPDAIMVLDIKDVSPVLLEPIHYDVQRINDPNKIDDVLTIRQQVWQSDYSSTVQSLSKRLIDAPHSLGLYVAYVDGKPVSTAQISFYQQGQFAGLVHSATLPDYRGRGLYTTLVAIRVQEAKRRGIRFLDADASLMSRPILEKLGFQWLTEAHSCGWRVKDVSSS
jgi:GNAT superfamily N-acetyltransferase